MTLGESLLTSVLTWAVCSTPISSIGKFYHLLPPLMPHTIAFIWSVRRARVQRWRVSWISSIPLIIQSSFNIQRFLHQIMIIISQWDKKVDKGKDLLKLMLNLGASDSTVTCMVMYWQARRLRMLVTNEQCLNMEKPCWLFQNVHTEWFHANVFILH